MRIRACKPLPQGVLASPAALADHLRRRRFDLVHSQPEAAAVIGVGSDTLQRWEADGVLPDPAVLDAVETYLGLCFVRWTRNIGVRLKAWRKARGLDQLRAARQIGVCLETITKLEKGRLDTAALEVRERVFNAVTDNGELAARSGSEPPAPTLVARASTSRWLPPRSRRRAGKGATS